MDSNQVGSKPMPRDKRQTGIPFTFKVNSDGSPTETSGKSLEELAIEQNPDVPPEEIKAAVDKTLINVYKIGFRKHYIRLKDQKYEDMSDEDKETWAIVKLLFYEEIHAEIEARLSKLEADIEAHNQREQSAKKKVSKDIAIAESLSEPIFMLNLPDEYLVKLGEAGFTSVGQVLFNIKVSQATLLSAYLAEKDESKKKKILDYAEVTKRSLSEIVGGTGYSLIGSRLLQYNYVTRSEFLDLFKGGV
jgi:hypothetical protein